MEWDESKHPRDEDGKFTDGNSGFRQNSSYGDLLKDTIKLPDETIPRSVGAKWTNHKIDLLDGTYATFIEGTKLQNKEVFAGAGCKRKIDCIDLLIKKYGGDPNKWVKVKAIAEIKLPSGETQKAEIHWYEEPSVGKRKLKRKRICE